MQTAFDLAGARPAAVAAVAGLRAVGAADRGVATIVERVVRQPALADVGAHPGVVPVGEGVRLPELVRLVPAELRRVGARRRLVAAQAGDPAVEPLEGAREYAGNYTKQLPNFICTEVIRRYEDPSGLDFWSSLDTLTARLGEPRRFLQVVAGARQVGKTTLVEEMLAVGGVIPKEVPEGSDHLTYMAHAAAARIAAPQWSKEDMFVV